MMIPSKKVQHCLLAVLFTTLATGAHSAAAHELRLAMQSDITGLDPHDTTDNLSYSVQSAVYERLFQFDRQMKLVPALATGYRANDNATEFVIDLRDNVRFSDGAPFNAAAAKTNLDRLADQEMGLKRNNMFSMIDHTEIINEHRIKIVLKQPFGAMINTLAHPSAVMISPQALKKYPNENDLRVHPVGTGPFIFTGWASGRSVSFVKNPNYWEKGWPRVDKVTFYPTPESATRVARLRAGEVDAVMPLDAQLTKAIGRDTHLKVVHDASVLQHYIVINNLKPALKDVRVRRALNYAMDRNIWLRAVHGNMGTVASAPMANAIPFYQAQTPYAHDPHKARELLKEAGYPDGLSLNMWIANDTSSILASQLIKQQLAAAGVRLQVVPMDSATRTGMIYNVSDPNAARYDLVLRGWSPSTGDADWALRPLFTTGAWVPKLDNESYYSNPQVDDAIQGALGSADADKRGAQYARAQQLIWKDAPVIFLGNPDNLTALSRDLEGVYMLPDTTFAFNHAHFVSDNVQQ